MISVIIPTCNRNDLLIKCLEKLKPGFQSLKEIYEVIITDDSRTNAARDLVASDYNWAVWVEGPKRGPASNRNNGVHYSNGKWLLFIDDDCLPDKNILKVYHEAISEFQNIEVFEGCIKADREKQSLIEECPVNETGGYLWSCNFMIKRLLFIEKLNGFDEKFPFASMEDVDLHYRLQKLNVECHFLPKAEVIHPWRIQHRLHSITMNRFKSTLYFLKKHPERKKDVNGLFYFRAFCHSFFGQTLGKSITYRFRGFFPKVGNDFLTLYLAAYLFFYTKR